jgi:glyoxylase-like metal-dependent hydrolase (beta-lactamase superfamily II)
VSETPAGGGAEVVAEFPQGLRIERVVTAGQFSLDGGTWDVENNVWLVGNDEEVVVIDAAHDPQAVLAAVGDRDLLLVVCTHGHNDHIDAAVEVAAEKEAEIALHPKDGMLWKEEYGADLRWDVDLADGGAITVADCDLEVLHTPGHTPGAVCLYAKDVDVVFTGDTLFHGGPGATGRKYSDSEMILRSIRRKLLGLPPQTRVLPGHGEETTIEAESADYDSWLEREDHS